MTLISKQPDIYLAGIRISEPVVTLTGLMIGAISFYAFLQVRHLASTSSAHFYFAAFFLFMSISSVVGPLFGHAFQYLVGIKGKKVSWILIVISQAALAQAVLEHTEALLTPSAKWTLTLINWLLAPLALAIAFRKSSFLWVGLQGAVCMLLVVLPFEWLLFSMDGNRSSELLVYAVPLVALSAIAPVLKWSPSVWFTFWDVSHVFVIIALYLILLAVQQLPILV
jgi:hypothetical protein